MPRTGKHFTQFPKYDTGTLVPGTRISVRVTHGLKTGVHGVHVRPVWHASRDGCSVPGYYATHEAAVYAAQHLSDKDILENLEDVYSPDGLCQAVTLADVMYVHRRTLRLAHH